MTYEPLEPRRLFAGLTFITHGYNGDINGWVKTAAADVAARAGGTSAASIYSMSVAVKSGKLAVTGFGPDSGQKDFQTTTGGELVLKLDWSTVSSGTYTTQQVAAVVNSYFQVAHGSVPALAELPIHLIGHSRGASLMSALSQDLGRSGIWVDQMTSLDPHPVDGVNDFLGADFGDAKMASYDNVAFADDYWRTDGDANNADFDGEPVAGAHQGNLNSTVQQQFFVSAHQAVTAYYNGTIDTSSLDGGDHPVLPTWYQNTKAAPARTRTGFAFSTIGGVTRPADGVSTLLGGVGERTAAGQEGAQWANAFNFTTRGPRTIAAGTTLTSQFFVADRDSTARVDVYLDQDQNPYDGAGLLTGKSFAGTALRGGRVNIPTTGLAAGTYYLAARATDAAGHVRWTYTPTTVSIAAPDFAAIAGRVLTLTGTAGNDAITLAQSASTVTLSLDGATQTFAASAVGSIQVQAGDGNDTVDGSGMAMPFYVNAGSGNDNVVGGAGNDTFSGGSGNDSLAGGAGDDALSGNAGNDLLVGNGGYDRLYGLAGNDTLIGSGNADRLYGGDGDDSLLGQAGNDRLYGEAGNDTLVGGDGSDRLDGGLGVNAADNDVVDYLRTGIDHVL